MTDSSRWVREPFRVFFPLGAALGAIGVGHWLFYVLGVSAHYSCLSHGLVQVQAFLPAFACGFLLTALPRRTGTAPPGGRVMVALALGLVLTAGAAVTGRDAMAQAAFLGVLLVLLTFVCRRVGGAARRPPASFVLLPIGLLQAVAGAVLLLVAVERDGPGWARGLGRLFVEQGAFACLVVGVATLLVPLMAGAPPPPDADTSPAGRRRVAGWALLGLGIAAACGVEVAGWGRIAPVLRGALVAWGLGWRGPQRLLARPGLNRRLMWLALRLTPLGMALSGLLPDYGVPALHVTFIGGFGLMVFAVATHVTYGHLGMTAQRDGAPAAVILAGAGIVLALLARVVADWSASYFAHLGAAAAVWIAGTGAWLALLGPRLLARDRPSSSPR